MKLLGKWRVTTEYGHQKELHPFRGTRWFHNGLDIVIEDDRIVFDVDVKIEVTGFSKEAGNWAVGWAVPVEGVSPVRIHLYHLAEKPDIRSYNSGEVVAFQGNTGSYTTGNHLHFGVQLSVGGPYVDPWEYAHG